LLLKFAVLGAICLLDCETPAPDFRDNVPGSFDREQDQMLRDASAASSAGRDVSKAKTLIARSLAAASAGASRGIPSCATTTRPPAQHPQAGQASISAMTLLRLTL